jgi:cell division protein ZapA (FtsZ GTPase activity inhibitor)
MIDIDVFISSIKCKLNIDEEEKELFLNITKSLNQKTNELSLDVGKINDRLVLFILLLINANKEKKIIDNFEKKIIELLKAIVPLMLNAPILECESLLDSQLVFANILEENKIKNIILKEENNEVYNHLLKPLEIKNENKEITEKELKNDKEMIVFLEEVTNIIKMLANNLDKG